MVALSAAEKKHSGDGVFVVKESNGFLPLLPALRHLPAGPRYDQLEALLQKVPVLLKDPSPDAIASQIEAIPNSLSQEWTRVVVHEPADTAQALYRDLSILSAAYLIDGLRKGITRTTIPAKVSVPFAAAAKQVDQQLIMEYSSYCLNNFYSLDGSEGHWDRLRLIRAFDGGPEEAAFFLIHSIIEQNTPCLIKAVNQLVKDVDAKDLAGCVENLKGLLEVQERMIVAGLQMFNASDPACYVDKVRPWIFGYKNNPDFPNGVIYEGVNDNKPQLLRGGTGAQSNILPVLDAVLGIEHAEDALLGMLKELEEYRPAAHRRYLRQVRSAMWGTEAMVTRGTNTSRASNGDVSLPSRHKLRAFVEDSGSQEACRAFNECIMGLYLFRAMHVVYSDLYISRRTNKEAATGGTPYKAYLRKHRDESIRQQVKTFPEAVISSPMPGPEEVNAALDECEKPDSNGIPSFLRERPPFSEMIRKYGGGHPSFERKMFPTKAFDDVRV